MQTDGDERSRFTFFGANLKLMFLWWQGLQSVWKRKRCVVTSCTYLSNCLAALPTSDHRVHPILSLFFKMGAGVLNIGLSLFFPLITIKITKKYA